MVQLRISGPFVTFFALFDIVVLSFCILKYFREAPCDELVFQPTSSISVAMSVGRTQHYNLDEPDGDIEWSRLIPSGGRLVYLKNDAGEVKKHTVTMLHQFHCPDIIRQQYNEPPDAPLSPLTLHCIKYLRQSILRHLHLGLESATNVWGTVAKGAEYVCRDWTELYRAVEDNQAAFGRASEECSVAVMGVILVPIV